LYVNNENINQNDIEYKKLEPEKKLLRIDYAVGFQVEYKDYFKVITVKQPWKGVKKKFQYLLVPKGKEVPKSYPNALTVRIPVSRIVLLSSTHLPLIERLGLEKNVVGFSNFKYLTDPFKERAEKGLIKELGPMTSPDLETLISIKPDLVITYGTGDPKKDSHSKIIEMGIPTAINAEYMESHPLGRFEWIKFVSVFFNKEEKAQEVFGKIKDHYEKLVIQTKLLTNRPKVVIGNNIRGIFYAPGGNSYIAKLVEDAGGDYIWLDDQSKGIRQLDLEILVADGSQADFWICHSLYDSMDELLENMPQTKNFKSVIQHKVYSNNRHMKDKDYNDYWTRGLSNPDLHLIDLIRIFHPNYALKGEFQWYRQLK
jgi:iron complex transport system substrate-binding protein